LFVKNSDFLIVPTEPDTLALATVIRVVKTFETLNTNKFKVLITKVPPKPSRAGEEAQTFLRDAGIPQFGTFIRRFEAFRKAVDNGVPVNLAPDPHGRDGWAVYVGVSKEIPL